MDKIKNEKSYYSIVVLLSLSVMLFSCQCSKKEKTVVKSEIGLLANQNNETIAKYLVGVRKSAGASDALARQYPNLDRERAYDIQMAMLAEFEKKGETLVGWKMGGAKVNDPAAPYDPVFGFMLASDEVKSGQTMKSTKYPNGSPLIEAEVGFVIGKDLKGPSITKEELLDAIVGVGGYSELISLRIEGVNGEKASLPHFIADGLSHGGFITPKKTFSLNDTDVNGQEGYVHINNEEIAKGSSKDYAFIDEVLLLSNSLLKYGRFLRAGDIVITGSILVSPPAKKGDNVDIRFSNYETLNVKFE